MPNRRSLSLIALVALAVSLGAIPLIVREDIPWQSLVAARVWLGALTLLALMAATNQLRIPKSHRVEIGFAGVLLAIHWATFFWAIKNTTVAVALAVVFLGPVSAAVLAPRFLGEVVPRRIYWALGTSFVGVVFVVVRQSGEDSTTEFALAGALIALVSAAAIALLMLVSKSAVDEVGALPVTTGELMVAAVVLSPWLPGAVAETAANPLPLLTLGIVLTGLSFLIIWTAIRDHSVAMVSVLLHIEPASAVVLALVFLDEVPDGWQWIGIGLVLAGGLLAARDAGAEEVLGASANL